MLTKRLANILTTTIFLLVFCACVKNNVSVVGVWERQIDEYVVRIIFSGDETFSLEVGERGKELYGEYKIRGGVILLLDDDCGDIEGKYRVETRENLVRFQVLNDACEGRVDVIAGEWQGIGNQ